jgi:hypothetical protein
MIRTNAKPAASSSARSSSAVRAGTPQAPLIRRAIA